MLNPQSPIPLYHQLADILLSRIRSGEYPVGTRLPSEHTLAGNYGIGRPTARQAIDLLVRKRIVERKRGSGTYVRAGQSEIDLFSLEGTISAFHKQGISTATLLLEKTRAETVPYDDENPFSGFNAYFLSRLTSVEETPVLIEDVYLHIELFRGIDTIDMEGRSLSQIVEERFYLRPVSGRQNFRISNIDGDKAHALMVSPDEPVLLVSRFLHFPQANNAIYSKLYCRTDKFVFSQTIGGLTYD